MPILLSALFERTAHTCRRWMSLAVLVRLTSLLALCSFLAPGLVGPATVKAEAPIAWQVTIDGVEAWITLLPRGHAVSSLERGDRSWWESEERPWWQWGNVTTDAYLFAFEQQDKVGLIVSFSSKGGLTSANFYLPDEGDERIKYTLDGDKLRVKSRDGLPYLTLSTRGGLWQSNGQPNYNLDLLLDGAASGNPWAKTDGVIDRRVEVYGQGLGLPDYEISQLVNDSQPNDASRRRFALTLRMPDGPEYKPAEAMMADFPFFGVGRTIPRSQWFVRNLPPIYFDVTKRILETNGFVGFEQGGVYALNSTSLPPKVDFESPFVFYGFDPGSRRAHLVVRADSFSRDDPYASYGYGFDKTSFRYSWKAFDENEWRYSLQLAGFHPYDRVQRYGGIEVLAPDYKELPTWITTKEWPILTFVESVHGYPGSEGIYFYTVQGDLPWLWLSGVSATPPAYLRSPSLLEGAHLGEESIRGLPSGFRGEFSTAYFKKPGLYLSPIDNRLHLSYAQGGFWNLGQGDILRTHNLSGGSYIDGWTREQVPEEAGGRAPLRAAASDVEEALYVLKGGLLYGGPNGVTFGSIDDPAALYETLPPTDKSTWEGFRQQLMPYEGKERDPRNLEKWIPTSAKALTRVSGGRIAEVRATPQGFRFVLTLDPDFQVSDPTGQARWLAGSEAGSYAVSYSREGGYTAKPLSPPSTRVTQLAAEPAPATALIPLQIRATVENSGLEDAHGLEVRFLAYRAGSTRPAVITRTADVLAESSTEIAIEWAPPTAGDWIVQASVTELDSSPARMEFSAAQPPATGLTGVLDAQSFANLRGGIVAVLLLAIAVFVGWLSANLWRRLESS